MHIVTSIELEHVPITILGKCKVTGCEDGFNFVVIVNIADKQSGIANSGSEYGSIPLQVDSRNGWYGYAWTNLHTVGIQ